MNTTRVEQLMSRTVATCRPDDSLEAAVRTMWERDCGVVPVTVVEESGERLVGVVTDRDACMAAYLRGMRLADIPVATAMSADLRTCGPKDSVRTALKVMATGQIHRVPVVDDAGRLVGVLSLADLTQAEARTHDETLAGGVIHAMEALSTPRGHSVVAAA